MRRWHNPFGIDLSTIILVGGGIVLVSQIGSMLSRPAETPPPDVVLPPGVARHYSLISLTFDSIGGIVKAGVNLVAHVLIAHRGGADRPTVRILVGGGGNGQTDITVGEDTTAQTYEAIVQFWINNLGNTSLGVEIIDGQTRSVAYSNSNVTSATAFP